MILGIVGWVVVGLLVGFITSKLIDLHGDDPLIGTAVACGGAVVAATLYTLISGAGVSSFNLWSLMFAATGAIAGIVTWHIIRARSVSREPFTRRRS